MHYINGLLAFIAHHSALAYGAIFLVSLSESLALVGLIVPGTVIMFGVGAIVAMGSLGLKPVLMLAAAGAIAGDGISYWLGRRYQEELRRIWPFSRYPGILKNGETFFHRHGGKSVLFGRFIGPVRPVIPIVAGMLGMGPLHFGVVNVLSAIGWAFAYILPGVFFGTSLAVAGAVSTRLTVLILLVVGTIWAFVWLCRKLLLFLEHVGPRWLASLEDWIASDTPLSGVMSSLRRFLSSVFLREKGEEFLLAFLVLVFFLTGWGFLGVLQDVVARDPLVRADQAVYHLFQSLRTPWGDHIFVAITELGDSLVNFFVAGSVLFTLLFRRCYRTAGYWLATLIGGACLIRLLKCILHLPRPVVLYHGISAFGFPSGHTTMSVVLYGFLALLIAKGLRNTVRWWFFVCVLLISFAVAFSRVYLGVHWLSDVLGGFLLASAWIALAGIGYLKGRPEVIPRRLLGIVTLIAFFAVGCWHVADRHRVDVAFYAPQHSIQMMTVQTWLQNGWKKLPAWRIDLGGEREQPVTIQWAGDADNLSRYLVSKGWQSPPVLNLRAFLSMLSPDTAVQNLLVLPHLHNGHLEKVLLVQGRGDKRWVFRLWPTDIHLKDTGKFLWVGTVETQFEYRLAGLITVAKDKRDYTRPLEIMYQFMQAELNIFEVYRKVDEIHVNEKHDGLAWNGRLLLIGETVQ